MFSRSTLAALTALAALLLSFASPASAQDLWQPRTSGVTVPLWSVAYAAGQWVAVGEQGTILTSPDGATWTPRASGFPARWLVGVGYGTPGGTGLWVVVGESGLILTSPDAITWTARRTAGTRINAVAYGNGTFVAADDAGSTYYSLDGIAWSGPAFGRATFTRGLVYGAPHFVTTGLAGIQTTYDGITSTTRADSPQLQAVAYGRRLYVATGGDNTYTSRDALTWTRQPSTTTTVGVQGATFFNNQFLAVGNAGGITTSFDASAWRDRVSGTNQTLLAVATSPDSAIAVGAAGTILQSGATPAAPVPTLSTSALTEAVGGNVALTVTTRGSAPFTYQWRKDGADLPGATTDTLFLANVQLAQSGTYACIVTNPVGTAATSPVPLTVTPTITAADPVDLALTLGVSLSTAPRTAVLQPDGKILIGGNFLLLNEGQAQFGLARLNPNGALDTTFKPGSIDPNAAVRTIVVQPDGKILIGGNFGSINGVRRTLVARLNTDGALDSTFVPPITSTNTVTQLALLADGRVVVVNNGRTLSCLLPDGSADPAWTSPSLAVGVGGTTVTTAGIAAVSVQPDGKIVAAFGATLPVSTVINAFLRRMNSNGSDDPTFPPVALNEPIGENSAVVSSLRVLPDGKIAASAAIFSRLGTFVAFAVRRFAPTGVLDQAATLTDIRFGSSIPSLQSSFTADGRLWLAGTFFSINGPARNQLARLNADGSLDPNFSPGTGLLTASGTTGTPTFIFPLENGQALVLGDFNRINSIPRIQIALLKAQSPGGPNAPAVIALDSYYREVRVGEPLTVQLTTTGSAPFTYTATPPPNFTSSTTSLTFPGNATQFSGQFVVSVNNASGVPATQLLYVRVLPSAPFIVAQPTSVQTNSGRSVTLGVTPGGSNFLSYQWFENGNAFTNATAATLTFTSPTPADSGDYTVVIRNSLGFATSQTVHLGVDETPRFVNIATRALAGRPDAPLIAGFVVAGPGNKRVMLRASGPTLAAPPFNLTGTLADPVLSVYNSAGTLIYTNDDWGSSNDVPGIASAGPRLGAFALQGGSADAAGILNLAPGGYTAVVTGKGGATGIALVEVYEDDNLSSRLINLSTRAYVGTDSTVAIPGIVTRGGANAKKLLVRAVGPGLTSFGVANVLANPTVALIDSAGKTVATNDDWETNPNLADLLTATASVTFPLAPGSKDAALLVSVPSGGYTLQVSGVANTTGNVLVEVYELP